MSTLKELISKESPEVQRKIKEPHIKISIFEEDESIITTIEDNAGGIKVEPIEKVFEPFFTFEKTLFFNFNFSLLLIAEIK